EEAEENDEPSGKTGKGILGGSQDFESLVSPTCLIESNTLIDESLMSDFQDALDKGMDMIIFQNKPLLEFFKVTFYEDEVSNKSRLVGTGGSAIYIDDAVGIRDFPHCLSQNLYETAPDDGVLVKQWLCSGGEDLQKITFISPDFFRLGTPTRSYVLELVQSPGTTLNEYTVSEKDNEGLGLGTILLLIFSITLSIFWIFFLIRKLILFAKREPAILTRRLANLTFISAIAMAILFALQIKGIPTWVFEVYALVYILSSLGLLIWGAGIRHALQKALQKFISIQWSVRLFSLCGVAWIYTFFLVPTWQWIPLAGMLLGCSLWFFLKDEKVIFRDYKEPFEYFMVLPLKALPIIFILWMGVQMIQSDSVYTWEAREFGNPQDIQLTDVNGNAIKGYYVDSENALLVNEPTVVSTRLNGSLLGSGNREISVSMTLFSNQELDLIPQSFSGETGESLIFTVPRFDELSLLYSDTENDLDLYRYSSAKTFVPTGEAIQELVELFMTEDQILTDLSLKTYGLNVTKSSFEVDFEELGEEEEGVEVEEESEEIVVEIQEVQNEGISVWDVPLWGNGTQALYVEVLEDQELLTIEITLTKFAEAALGAEFLNITLIDSNGIMLEIQQEEIIHEGASQDKQQRFEFETQIDPGLYKVVMQGVSGTQEYLQKDLISAYQIDSISVNSPILMLYTDELKVAGKGEVVVKNIGDNTHLIIGEEESKMEALDGLQTVEFGEEGGMIQSDTKLLYSLTKDRWVSPFYVLVTNSVKKLTDYLIIEAGTFEHFSEDKDGNLIFTKIFQVPRDEQEVSWLIQAHDKEAEASWVVKDIIIEVL
ncbi:MAG: hypothetical protein Q8P27_00860, partial [Candidatus Peregrinibacteria bacterium]|nr:hypothetical protein [Candidatus Peregrinibacteria bacterium]